MDQIVAQALTVYAKICGEKRSNAAALIGIKKFAATNGDFHAATDRIVEQK